jgi:hypothetical protein
MVSLSTRPSASAVTLPPTGTPGQDPARTRVVNLSAGPLVDRGDLLPRIGSTQRPTVIPDPCAGVATPVRIVGPTPHGAAETVERVRSCPPPSTGRVVCADDARCICPLSGHITDAERTVMNDVCGQAAHLATVLRWVLAFAALAVLIVLMR